MKDKIKRMKGKIKRMKDKGECCGLESDNQPIKYCRRWRIELLTGKIYQENCICEARIVEPTHERTESGGADFERSHIHGVVRVRTRRRYNICKLKVADSSGWIASSESLCVSI